MGEAVLIVVGGMVRVVPGIIVGVLPDGILPLVTGLLEPKELI